jgi:hypothetical protein
MRKVIWGIPLVLGLSCGGTSIRTSPDDDDDGSTGIGGSNPGAGGSFGKGGYPGKGGSPGQGGTVQGGFPGKGGTSGRGGTAGFPGKGGTVGKGGISGSGGEGPPSGEGPGGIGPGGAGSECHYVPIGAGRRCENAGSRVQDDTSLLVEEATTLGQCARICSLREDCTAITDYFSEPGLDACYLRHGSCNVVAVTNYSEEDAGKEHRKVCDANGACRIEYLGDWQRCTDPGATLQRLPTALSRTDCFNACVGSASCTSVVDYFWIRSIRGCYLYTSTCNSPELLPAGDPGVTYRKVCD